jgi:hypothetical protein
VVNPKHYGNIVRTQAITDFADELRKAANKEKATSRLPMGKV